MKNDIIIIGGGIIGISTGYHLLLAKPNLKILLLEKESDLGQHQSGRNSGVIHSGIYYTPGSVKAEYCQKGYKMLLNYCTEFNIRYNMCGKIIVATEECEIPDLEKIYIKGLANGLKGIRKISSQEIRDIEPNCIGLKGIHVPYAGIIDYGEVLRSMADRFIKMGGQLMCDEQVIDIKSDKGKIVITDKNEFRADYLVSCSGLQSDRVAQMENQISDFRVVPFKGEYFELVREMNNFVNGLIYPVPNPNFPFLGVHLTKMVNGSIKAGPNAVLAFKREGYGKMNFSFSDFKSTVSHSGFRKLAFKYWKEGLSEIYRSINKQAFVRALQKMTPAISDADLIPSKCGIRAQAINNEGDLLDDFKFIENEKSIHVCNAPSPAATSSLAIGEAISNKLIKKLSK